MTLAAADRKKLVPLVEDLARAVESLLLAGLTTASQATRETFDASFREASRLGLLRLARGMALALPGHLASRVRAVVDGVRAGDPGAAAALLRARTSLRLFERILTLEAAGEALAALAGEDDDS